MLSGLKSRTQYLHVAASSLKYVTPSLVVQARRIEGATDVRFGITASRKVGHAVQRNRAKRRLRVIARFVLPVYALSGVDYVLIARRAVLDVPFTDLRAEFEKAVQALNKKI